MSLSSALFGSDSLIHKATNILGLGIPGWLDKQFGAKEAEPQIRTLGELSQQTAKEAEPRPIVWGRVRPIGGNIIHCQAPVTRMITTSVDGGGGKGGSKKKQKQTTQHVYRTYAIGVCEGPITGYMRIWRNNKLVYDARGNEWGEKNNTVFLRQFRLYLGHWNQLPDPTLEAIWGVGNVPAYRGTAYIVSIDEDLTDLAGSVPQFIFEVERAEYAVATSTPYGVLDQHEVSASLPKPGRGSVTTEIRRFPSVEVLGAGLPTPGDITAQNVEFPYTQEDRLSVGLATPNNIAIDGTQIRAILIESIRQVSPTPNNITAATVTVRFANIERLNTGNPVPNDVHIEFA